VPHDQRVLSGMAPGRSASGVLYVIFEPQPFIL